MSEGINLADPLPESDLDLLADIISNSHKGSMYERGWYEGAWNLRFESTDSRGFHIVTSGRAYVQTDAGETFDLHAGDIVLMSAAHNLGSDLSAPAVDFSPEATRLLTVDEAAGDVCMLCGAYTLDNPDTHPVFSNLPPVILLRAGDRDPAVDAVVTILDGEFRADAPGARTVANRLIDAMLVYILRHWIESDCPTALAWLKALRDPILSRALALIHNEFHRDWTLESLARASGTSRATLARNFTSEVGTSPIQFLTERRLTAARDLLEQTSMSLDEIADRVGYGSAFSLSKAFKREFGAAPTHYVS